MNWKNKKKVIKGIMKDIFIDYPSYPFRAMKDIVTITFNMEEEE